jgi:hypothetical protein
MKKLPELAFPKPPPVAPVAEDDAQRFERSEEKAGLAQAVASRTAPPVSAPSDQPKRGSRLKRDSLGERVTVYLPPKLAEAVRRRCVRERRSVSDALTEATEMWMSSWRRQSSANE